MAANTFSVPAVYSTMTGHTADLKVKKQRKVFKIYFKLNIDIKPFMN